jgi:hypothetical protein
MEDDESFDMLEEDEDFLTISSAYDRLLELHGEISSFTWDSSTCRCRAGSTETLEIRVRQVSGRPHFVHQCLNCGEQRGGAIKAELAYKLLGDIAAAAFDPQIEVKHREPHRVRYAHYTKLLKEKNQLELFLQSHTNFEPSLSAVRMAESEELKSTALKITEQVDAAIAQFGVDKALGLLAEETYRHKKAKRDALRTSVQSFASEGELKDWLETFLAEDFEIHKEPPGRHLAEDVGVQIDYIFTAKEHLLRAGFDLAPFGVEVKHITQDSGFMHKATRGIWQTISYNDCEFKIASRMVRPKYCMIFSNLAFKGERELLYDLGFNRNNGENYENDKVAYSALLHLANHARVGSLEIKGERESYRGWEFRFVGGVYFSARHYADGWHYVKSNENLINKRRIGNF